RNVSCCSAATSAPMTHIARAPYAKVRYISPLLHPQASSMPAVIIRGEQHSIRRDPKLGRALPFLAPLIGAQTAGPKNDAGVESSNPAVVRVLPVSQRHAPTRPYLTAAPDGKK